MVAGHNKIFFDYDRSLTYGAEVLRWFCYCCCHKVVMRRCRKLLFSSLGWSIMCLPQSCMRCFGSTSLSRTENCSSFRTKVSLPFEFPMRVLWRPLTTAIIGRKSCVPITIFPYTYSVTSIPSESEEPVPSEPREDTRSFCKISILTNRITTWKVGAPAHC